MSQHIRRLVLERGVTQADGKPLPDTWVGLRSVNRAVRDSIPQAFRDYLIGLEPWFDRLDNFRHALAHRIPLYIPPYVVKKDDVEAYEALERDKITALFSGHLAEHKRLDAEQKKLIVFMPWMQHSFHEGADPLVFHP